MPTRRLEGGTWLHPSRLPLGGGWQGHCCAPGHDGETPSEEELTHFCNLGYAAACARLPQTRSCDAVRFSVARERGALLSLWYVCEAGHVPAEHGTLEYDTALGLWTSMHANPRIQKMAECYLESYLLRRTQPALAG